MDARSRGIAPETLARTRLSLHQVAEHVLAAARYAATGRIGLAVTDDGFGTPPFGDDQRSIHVVGSDLVVRAPGAPTRRHALTTVADLAAACGVTPGGPAQVYELATPLHPTEPLQVDQQAAEALQAWFHLGHEALTSFVAAHPADGADPIVLWPEHFDHATAARACNYGVSPGDDYSALPYLYVGPWDESARRPGGFWNAPFGAALTWNDVPDATAARAFFEEGRQAFLGHSGN